MVTGQWSGLCDTHRKYPASFIEHSCYYNLNESAYQ